VADPIGHYQPLILNILCLGTYLSARRPGWCSSPHGTVGSASAPHSSCAAAPRHLWTFRRSDCMVKVQFATCKKSVAICEMCSLLLRAREEGRRKVERGRKMVEVGR